MYIKKVVSHEINKNKDNPNVVADNILSNLQKKLENVAIKKLQTSIFVSVSNTYDDLTKKLMEKSNSSEKDKFYHIQHKYYQIREMVKELLKRKISKL